MDSNIQLRLIFFAALFLAFFLLPWWALVPAVLAYCIYYTPAVEVIALGFLADHIYGVSYTYTILSALLSICMYFIRSKIRV